MIADEDTTRMSLMVVGSGKLEVVSVALVVLRSRLDSIVVWSHARVHMA